MAGFTSVSELKFVANADELLKAGKAYDDLVAKTKSYGTATQSTTTATKQATTEAEKYLAKIKAQSEAIGKTRSELAALRAAQLGVTQAASPYIKAMQDAEAKNKSFKSTVEDINSKLGALGGPLGDAAGALESFGSKIASITSIGVGFLPVLLAMAGAAGVLAAVRFAGPLDDLGDLAGKLGLSATQTAILDQQMKASGTSVETYYAGIQRVVQALSKSDEEGKAAATALELLGINTKELTDPFEVAAKVAEDYGEKLKGGKISVDEMAALQLVLGKNYREQIIAQEAANTAQERMNAFAAAGVGISKDGSEAAGNLETAQNDLGIVLSAVGSKLVGEVVPAFTGLIQQFVESYKNGGLVKSAFDGIRIAAQVVMAPIRVLINTFIMLDTAITGVGKSIGALFAAIATRSLDPFKALGGDLGELVKGAGARMTWAPGVDSGEIEGPIKQRVTPTKGGLTNAKAKGGEKKDPFKDAMDKASGGIAESNQQLQQGEALKAAEKLRLEILGKIEKGEIKVTDEKKAQFLAATSLWDLSIRENKQATEELEATKRGRDEEMKLLEQRESIIKKYDDKAKDRLDALQTEIDQRGMSTREIKLQNDLRTIQRDLEAEILELTEKNVSASEKQTLIDAARSRAGGRVGARRGIEEQEVARDGDYWGGLTRGFQEYADTTKSGFDTMREVGSRTASTIENSFMNAATRGELSMKAMARSILAELAAIAAKMAVVGLIKAAFGGSTGGYSASTQAGLDGLIAGVSNRASGGFLAAGQTSWVGEQGRELITAPAGGLNVTPAHMAGGSSSNVIHAPMTITIQGDANEKTLQLMDQKLALHRQQIMQAVPSAVRNGISLEQRDRGLLAGTRR